MTLGVFDTFKVGIAPSSSHTMDPMRATREFVACGDEKGASGLRSAAFLNRFRSSYAPRSGGI